MTPTLYQFAFSHYNEKARWALDWKGVPHLRRSLLPGPHVPVVMRLTGQKQVPVLATGDQVIAGSARIIDFLEHAHPAPPLYPERAAARRQALELQRWFDDEVGAPIRCAFFHDFLPDGRYAARCFSATTGRAAATLYSALFPLVRIVMRRDMKITPASAREGIDRTFEALDRVVALAGGDGYLVGDAFTVADLTAASLLSAAAFPEGSPMPLPEPRSPVLDRWIARFAGHPGVEWVETVYRRHRGRSAEVTSARGAAA